VLPEGSNPGRPDRWPLGCCVPLPSSTAFDFGSLQTAILGSCALVMDPAPLVAFARSSWSSCRADLRQ